MEFLAPLLWKGVAAPALAAALLLACARGASAGRLACAAVALAYATGHALLRWPWPVAESTDRLALFALGLGAAAALLPARPAAAAMASRLGAAVAGAAWWWGRLLTSQAPAQAAWRLAVAGLALGLPWIAMEGLARRRPGALAPAVMLAATAGGAAVLVLSRTAFYAQLAGALAAALAVLVVRARRRPDLARAAGPAAAILAALLAAGVVLAELPVAAALLVLAPTATAWITWTPRLRAGPAPHAALAAALTTGLLLAAAVIVAGLTATPPVPY